MDDVSKLEGKGASGGGWATFGPAFLILLREGIEAMLVLLAIIAYLRKSGNDKYLKTVYNYSLAAIVASFITAYLFSTLISQEAGVGASREMIEGVTALVAVVVLFFTSAWLGAKSDKNAWKEYIENMINTTMTTGRARALGMAAFLAVYREGAEVILFYQALFNNSSSDTHLIWAGFGAGCVVLAVLFFLMHSLAPFLHLYQCLNVYLGSKLCRWRYCGTAGGRCRQPDGFGIIRNSHHRLSRHLPHCGNAGSPRIYDPLGYRYGLL